MFHHRKRLKSTVTSMSSNNVFKDDKKSCVLPVGLGVPLSLSSSCYRDFVVLDAFAHRASTSQLLALFFLHCFESWTRLVIIVALFFCIGLQANSVKSLKILLLHNLAKMFAYILLLLQKIVSSHHTIVLKKNLKFA